ncbi:restriction endonuclease subunit S [Aeromonas veronii]
MSSEWPVLPLEDCLDALIDYRGKTPVKTDYGVPLVTAKVIKGGRIETPTEFIAPEDYDSWMRRGIPLAGDVVMTTEAPLGEVAQLGAEQVALAQRVITLRGKTGFLDNAYLLYLLQTEEMQDQLKSRATGTTVLGIKQSELRKVRVKVPPFDLQQSVAGALKTLEDRIALLRETNATLESIAETLFKSWFVDFDPVHARARGEQPAGLGPEVAALFPDSFEESELGMVPKGWSWSVLGNVCTDHGGTIQTGPFGSQLHASDYVQEGTPVVMPKDISGRRVDGGTAARIGMSDVERLFRHQLQIGDIVFSRRGDVEKHALIGELEQGWLCGTGCLLVRPGKNWCSPGFLSRLLDLKSTKRWLTQHAVGATMPNLNTGILASVPVLLPSREVLMEFEQLTHVLDTRISENNATIQTLANLRDTLLPRLISGQLRLPDAEAMVSEAQA